MPDVKTYFNYGASFFQQLVFETPFGFEARYFLKNVS